jgi:hypothetical protein
VLGGELVADCADSLGYGNAAWNSPRVYIYNGGILSFDGTFDPLASSTRRTNLELLVMSSGGAIKVPNASDVVTLTKNIGLYGGAHFRKLGAGTLKLSGAQFVRGAEEVCNPGLMHVEYCEGTIEQTYKFSEGTEFTLADNGVTLVGSKWLNANQAGANGGGSRMELSSRRIFHVGSGGATVDVHGVNTTINDANYYYGVDRCPEFLSGEGELTVVDALGVATLKANYYRDTSFRGKFTSYVPFSGAPIELRNAEMHVPQGVTHVFSAVIHDRQDLRFGRLSGSGTLDVTASQDYRPT